METESNNGKIHAEQEGLDAGHGDPHRGGGPDHGPVHVGSGIRRPLGAVLALTMLLVIMHRGWEPPDLMVWVGSYLDDLLCLPVILGVVLAALRVSRHRPDLTLPAGLGLAALAMYAGWFELVLPRVSTRATADPLDAVAYAAGLALFMTVINRPGSVARERKT